MTISTLSSFVKICGVTNVEDARSVVAAGADALGLILAESPRHVSINDARLIADAAVGDIEICLVFRDTAEREIEEALDQVPVSMVQFYGEVSARTLTRTRERGLFSVRALGINELARVDELAVDAVHVDGVRPGSGEIHEWTGVNEAVGSRPLIAAGGLHVENVEAIIAEVRPWGVDCASGVERSLGRKDPQKVATFVEVARRALLERTSA